MLNYPLNWNYSIDIMKNDLDFYLQMTSDRTPAMTWSWFTIGFKWVNEDSHTRTYFYRSYHDYIVQPFKVIETLSYNQFPCVFCTLILSCIIWGTKHGHTCMTI